MEKLRKILRNSSGLPCLICGVDSYPIKVFLGTFVGCFFIGSVLIFAWAWGTGRLKSTGREEAMAIKAESKGDIHE